MTTSAVSAATTKRRGCARQLCEFLSLHVVLWASAGALSHAAMQAVKCIDADDALPVSVAELIIPASDLSQHISTAGFEASGTSNMKFCMNGSLLLGSRDGANLEIENAIGKQNIFMFGANSKEVETLQSTIKYRKPQMDGRLQQVLEEIAKGRFGNEVNFASLIESLQPGNDVYMVGHDFGSYLEVNEMIDAVFVNPEEWTTKCILTCASMSQFSSDRCIREYADKIWHVEPHQFTPPAPK